MWDVVTNSPNFVSVFRVQTVELGLKSLAIPVGNDAKSLNTKKNDENSLRKEILQPIDPTLTLSPQNF